MIAARLKPRLLVIAESPHRDEFAGKGRARRYRINPVRVASQRQFGVKCDLSNFIAWADLVVSDETHISDPTRGTAGFLTQVKSLAKHLTVDRYVLTVSTGSGKTSALAEMYRSWFLGQLGGTETASRKTFAHPAELVRAMVFDQVFYVRKMEDLHLLHWTLGVLGGKRHGMRVRFTVGFYRSLGGHSRPVGLFSAPTLITKHLRAAFTPRRLLKANVTQHNAVFEDITLSLITWIVRPAFVRKGVLRPLFAINERGSSCSTEPPMSPRPMSWSRNSAARSPAFSTTSPIVRCPMAA
ncbi:hypothetical protein [Azospirillum argentinense]|uniref:hypothetical protein n=1 Tax=Azospirillum argentinense TaxID=2970906 RepID=UPI0032DFFF22